MLQQLLAEIKRGGTLNAATLAARLHVSPTLIEMMLEDLERRGKLSRLKSQCSSGGCGDCPAATACTPQKRERGRVWIANNP